MENPSALLPAAPSLQGFCVALKHPYKSCPSYEKRGQEGKKGPENKDWLKQGEGCVTFSAALVSQKALRTCSKNIFHIPLECI